MTQSDHRSSVRWIDPSSGRKLGRHGAWRTKRFRMSRVRGGGGGGIRTPGACAQAFSRRPH